MNAFVQVGRIILIKRIFVNENTQEDYSEIEAPAEVVRSSRAMTEWARLAMTLEQSRQ